MRKIIFLFFSLISFLSFGQQYNNIVVPNGSFLVDGNPSPTSKISMQNNYNLGAIGVYCDSFNIYNKLRYTGSTPVNGYFLKSDANGFCSWAMVSGDSGIVNGYGIYINHTIPRSIAVDTTVILSKNNASKDYVPYIGALGNVNIGNYSVTTIGINGGSNTNSNLTLNSTLNSSPSQGSFIKFLQGSINLGLLNGNVTSLGLNAGASNTGTGTNGEYFGYAAGEYSTALFNVCVGSYALSSGNNDGGHNTAIGRNSLYNNYGSYNTGVGYNDLQASANSSYNTGVGALSLYSNTANNSTALGYQSMYSNTTGTGNVGIGYQSLYTNITGIENTGIGYQAINNTTGSQNVGIGYDAGNNNTTGSYNTIIGDRAGKNTITTGSNNTLIGASSDLYTGTFNNSTAIGNGALSLASNSVTLGNSNVNALYFSNTGTTNIYGSTGTSGGLILNSTNNVSPSGDYIGFNVGGNHFGYFYGSGGVFLGSGAGGWITSPTGNNVGIGYNALSDASGTGNVAIGFNCLKYNTTGTNNIAIGNGTLTSNTGNSYNTCIGSSSMSAVTSNNGSMYNTVIGNYSLNSLTSGSNNLVLCNYGAGGNITNGSQNICVGDYSKPNGNYSNSIAIGYNSLVNASNTIQLGNSNIIDVQTNGNIDIIGTGNGFKQHTGSSNDLLGTITLVSGVASVTISGLVGSGSGKAFAFLQLKSVAGTIGNNYIAVITSNTLTVTSVNSTGSTVTSDNSTLNYEILKSSN